jgi:hypothetical protein
MVRKLGEVLERLGYAPEKRFNALNGNQRLMYMDHINGRQMDVFVDRFEMCHKFDLRQRVAADPDGLTLPLADLVLTKMQIVEINFKDMQDTAALLQDHPLTDDETGINITYITRLTGSDWGLQRTLEITLTRLEEGENLARLQAESPRFPLESQIAQLREAMQGAPKSTGWKLRAKVGERVKWYEVPEEARG